MAQVPLLLCAISCIQIQV